MGTGLPVSVPRHVPSTVRGVARQRRVAEHPGCPNAHLREACVGTRAALPDVTMSKAKRSKRTRKSVDRSATTDVVTQLECAFRNPHAALIGAVIGGLVPWFGRTLAHDQVPAAWSAGHTTLASVMLVVVLGCALFSALSVYKFGKAAFGDSRKALGWLCPRNTPGSRLSRESSRFLGQRMFDS